MWNTNKAKFKPQVNADVGNGDVVLPPTQSDQSLVGESMTIEPGQPVELSAKPSDHPCALSLVDTTSVQETSSGELSQNGMKARAGKDKGKGQVDHPTELFSIFGKRTVPDVKIPSGTPDANVRSQKLPLDKARLSCRTQSLRRTTTATDRCMKSAVDDVFAGPSSQPLPRLPKELPKESSRTTQIAGNVDRLGTDRRTYEGGSRDEPIIVDSSPTKSPQSTRKPVAVGFFAPRRPGPSNLSVKHPPEKLGDGDYTHWPNLDTQHVRGAQQTFEIIPLDFARTHSGSSKPYSHMSPSPLNGISHRTQPAYFPHAANRFVQPVGAQTDGHAMREDVMQSNATCPAISRFLTADHDISGASWNERWRPRCSTEVLGNETSANYLRGWLLALEIKDNRESILPTDSNVQLGGSQVASKLSRDVRREYKRPNIIRTVEKPRKKRRIDSDEESLGDWVVDEEEEEEEEAVLPDLLLDEVDDNWPEASEASSPPKPKLTRLTRRHSPGSYNQETSLKHDEPTIQAPAHDISTPLTNTILLAGPSGTGKSAAVYACAEELGWEVFEVYPGIGRRNGASLLNLVGDVGKNHTVGKASWTVSGSSKKNPLGDDSLLTAEDGRDSKDDGRQVKRQTFTSFFSAGAKASTQVANNDRAETSHERPSPVNGAEVQHRRAQQSIILLEEVDILFGEDTNFWPTVVTLIRESRRPVIMTCNDLSIIPCDDLPLQKVLAFSPCSSELAASYLQCLALAEGYAATKNHMKALYENSAIDVAIAAENILCPSAHQPSPTPDLRRAINSLQFLCLGDRGLKEIPPGVAAAVGQERLASYNVQEDEEVLHNLWELDWPYNIMSEAQLSPDVQAEPRNHANASQFHRLWQISDMMSVIDSDLSRRPSTVLEMHSSEGMPSSDYEVGYRHLVHEPEMHHLQGGIALYNYDKEIASEAVVCVKHAMGRSAFGSGSERITYHRTEEHRRSKTADLLREQTCYFTRVSGVLGRIVPAVSRETLVMDYLPWIRVIDCADAGLEAASLREAEGRTVLRGGRTTRNSQRVHYERYFGLDKEQRDELQKSGLRVDRVEDTLCGGGVDHEL
ncbi:hypothetical protein M0805_007432 [Coniferiporia weirii]|nr:hypothetical protein M0805_007432 [Coniferiporia weirii]